MPARIGLIVPSSNTTMETELPAIFGRLDIEVPVTFHSARVRMKEVTQDELTRMVESSETAAESLADMRPDALAYACLVAVMSQGVGYHETAERALSKALANAGSSAPVVSSAGALLEGIAALNVTRVAVVAPYMKPLTAKVVDYIQAAGTEVVDSLSLEVSDNLKVGCLPAERRLLAAQTVDITDAEAIVLSACVQMPSLDLVERIQQERGLPVLTAATATAWSLMKRLDLPTSAPGAGALLDGTH
ncbi:maleate cis-trans isomerase family protein [Rhodococcus koreensis]